mgnify:CR=1 FL=1
MFVDLVMLVDDNDTDNFIHKRIIELTGFAYRIEVKNTAAHALEYLAEMAGDLENLPDLIFLDMNMPVSSGESFLLELQKMPLAVRQKCSIVVLSSQLTTGKPFAAYPNVKKVLKKPLTEDTLNRLKEQL